MKHGHKRSEIKKKKRRMKHNALAHQMQSAMNVIEVQDFGKLGQAGFSVEDNKAASNVSGGDIIED